MIVRVLINRSLRVSVLASAIFVSFTLVTTNAEEKRPVTVEDILSMKTVSDPQMSPDGTRIAYVLSEANLEKNINDSDIWVVGTGGGDTVRLTRGPKLVVDLLQRNLAWFKKWVREDGHQSTNP